MRFDIGIPSWAAAVALAVVLLPGLAVAGAFTVADLGTLGGSASVAAAVNASGQVVGWSTTAAGETHAFLYDGAAMRDLGTLGGGTSAATAVNASGQVAGWSTTAAGETHAFLFDGATMRDLGTLGGGASAAIAVNASGQVAGWSTTAAGESHAFLYDGAAMRDLGALGGDSSAPTAMNDIGQVAGWSRAADGEPHAFLYDGASLRDLCTLGSLDSVALDLNNRGEVVGWYSLPPLVSGDHRITRAFLFDGVEMRDLGTLGGQEAVATVINDHGQVAGAADLPEGDRDSHAFLYEGTGLIDLGTLGGDESEALAINELGQILGQGDIESGEGGTYKWAIWSGGSAVNLETTILAAGYAGVGGDLYLGDGGHVAGTALNPEGDCRALPPVGNCRAFLLVPTSGLKIALQVRPRSRAGVVNPGSRGVVQVALLSQPGLSLPALVDRTSLAFGRSGNEASLVGCLPASRDANGDGFADLICHFSVERAGLARGDAACALTGRMTDGRPLSGSGTVRSVPR